MQQKGLNVIGIDGRYCLHRRSDKLIAKNGKICWAALEATWKSSKTS
jgi:hypothetical protein